MGFTMTSLEVLGIFVWKWGASLPKVERDVAIDLQIVRLQP